MSFIIVLTSGFANKASSNNKRKISSDFASIH